MNDFTFDTVVPRILLNDGDTSDAARGHPRRATHDPLLGRPSGPLVTDSDLIPETESEPEGPPDEGSRRDWVVGLIAIVLLIVGPIVIFTGVSSSVNASNADDPWANVPTRVPHVDHTDLMPGPYETGPEVTEACLECHADAGEDMLHSEHWLWANPPVELPGRDEPVVTGKANTLNNFCLGIRGNEPKCTS